MPIVPPSPNVDRRSPAPAVVTAPWDAPLRAAWARAEETLHQSGAAIPPDDLRAVADALDVAGHTLDRIGTLRRCPSLPPGEVSQLIADTIHALTWLTDQGIAQATPLDVLTWLLSQDSQLRTRVASWALLPGVCPYAQSLGPRCPAWSCPPNESSPAIRR